MSTIIAGTQPATGSLAAFVQRHPLPIFFFLAFVFTWPVEIIDALGSHGIIPFRPSIIVQLLFVAYMPTIAALTVTALIGGRAGVRELLGKLLIWRIGARWYAIALFGFIPICMLAVALYNALGGTPTLPLLSPNAANASGPELVLMIVGLLIISALINGEELAWRGFALPRLQERWNALTASIILGVIWALWHLPLYYTLGSSQADMPFICFMLQPIGLSVLFTWLYNNSRGSILPVYLLHASINTWTRIFPIDHAPPLLVWCITGIICLAAMQIVCMFGAERLARRQPE